MLKLLTAVALTAMLATPIQAAQWNVTREKSPIDDSPFVTAITIAQGGSSLVLRCRDKTVDVFVAVPRGNYIGSKNPSVIYRINGDTAVKATWSIASSGIAAFAKSGFIDQLPDDAKLFVRIADFRNVFHDASFELGKISTIRDQVKKACGK